MPQESPPPSATGPANNPPDFHQEQQALSTIISVLKDVNAESRARLLGTVATFFRIQPLTNQSYPLPTGNAASTPPNGTGPFPVNQPSNIGSFSTERALSPKEFIANKQPHTDVERIACLGFYLTHYRDTPHFKTFDLSKLNTEAAQPKFTNAAYATNNALKLGYLAPALKGNKQLSVAGERFVLELPDREAARKALQIAKPKRKSKRNARTNDRGSNSE